MNRITAGMKWIMLVSGLLTCTMVYALIAPRAALQSTFGEVIEGDVAEIVVRNWGMLIALVGVMLVYGAFRVAVRPLVLTVAGLSKVTFIALVLSIGPQFLTAQAGVAVVSDLVQVLLFAAYLIVGRRVAHARA